MIIPKRFIPLFIMLGFLAILIITPLVAAYYGFPIVAMDDTYISIASFDFYTLAHLLWGVAIFVVCFTFGFIARNRNRSGNPQAPLNPPGFKKLVIYWAITLAIAGIWEIVENTILILTGIKVEYDSPPNIITDITIWGFGALVSWYMTDIMFLSQKIIRAYYIYGIISLAAGILLFFAFGLITTL
jgi:hypothetical protein